ncbi:hypothetical protein MVEN_01819700 [Mycena venus]|uniref:FAD/NAD(P)-binding domain-containing protein n=1 Tax=Mycena venus TaxID=2733690 RepID=A0A8H7CP18_9AGAR|nr:hypothetical protein MVEN_01819700 [Mycena venus]
MGISHSSVFLASAGVFLVAALGIAWHKHCTSPPEWIKELEVLGRPRKEKLDGTAVVCGGRRVFGAVFNLIAGTVAARVLADHFDRVILVDPELDDMERPRTRIMQYNAAHGFLTLFVDGVRRLCPDFDKELSAAGGRIASADYNLHYSGIPIPSPYGDFPGGRLPGTLAMRRSEAQKTLYRLLIQHSTAAENISVCPGTVRGVESSEDNTSILSVIVRKPDGTQLAINDISLVVGTSQAGVKWLGNAGYTLPANLRCFYKPNIRYVTICFSVSPEIESKLPIPQFAFNRLAEYVYIQHFTYGSFLAALTKTDNNTMQLMLTSSEDNLPRTMSEVIPFISTIRGHEPLAPWFVETVEKLCEHCPDASFDILKIPDQSYVKYHSVPEGSLPRNFVAVGDSNLQLNPVHGQGFAKIMLNAITLNSLLHSLDSAGPTLPPDFSARYFKTNSARTEGLWNATRMHDYGASTCEPMGGETRDTGRLVRWFRLKILSAATQYEDVASVLWHVHNLIAADKALFAPRILGKVLWTPSRF